jgi:PTH1 family peptidyl-tRNA hydrolase
LANLKVLTPLVSNAEERNKLIVGLGNPGLKYKHNRHNIGFRVVERLAGQFHAVFKRSFLLGASLAKIKVQESAVILLKPLTFMNNCGGCVRKALSRYRVSSGSLLVIYDDADLALGALRFRKKGSSAGHNGMASVIKALGSQEINRLRIGIGRSDKDLTEHVLGDFTLAEQEALDETLNLCASACKDWIKYGSDYVMNRYNQMRQ